MEQARSHPLVLQEHHFRLLVDSILDYAIFMIDPAGTIVSWNAGAARLKGYTADEIIGSHLSRFYPPEDRDKPARAMEIAAREGHFEAEGWRVRKDGSRFWANVVLTALRDPSGELIGFAKVTRDLTERMMAQEALRQSEEQIRLLVASVIDYAIFMLDPTGKIVSWNTGAARMKGYSAEEIIGSHFSIFYPPEDADKPAHELEIARRDGRVEDVGWRVRKDGSRFWADVIITALRDEAGQVIGFAKVTRDLTEQKHIEDFRERFIANAAHEIRTPLTTVKGLTDLLGQPEQLDPELFGEVVSGLRRGVDRLTALVENLLDLARFERGALELHPMRVTVDEVVAEAVEGTQRLSPKTVTVRGAADAEAWGDARRLGQVLTNLLVNAHRYGGGNITVDVGRTEGNIEIAVADDGTGLAEGLVPRLFEPFVRGDSSREAGGSGLGLSIVQALTEAMGGHVRYEPAEPSGARFIVSLRAAD